MRIKPIPFVLAVVLLALAGCGGTGGLANSAWYVQSLRAPDGSMAQPVGPGDLTADFGDDAVDGESGCNGYSGPYSTDGDTFSAGPLSATRQFCDIPGVMDQETTFLAHMSAADRWVEEGDQLDLYQGDELLIQFARLIVSAP